MWPFKRGRLSPGVEINTFMLKCSLTCDLSRGVDLSPEWPLKRGTTLIKQPSVNVVLTVMVYLFYTSSVGCTIEKVITKFLLKLALSLFLLCT